MEITVIDLMAENKGNAIVRDLLNAGCTKWEIMNRFRDMEGTPRPRLAWNSVSAWAKGLFCDPDNIPYLERVRAEWYQDNDKDPFRGAA